MFESSKEKCIWMSAGLVLYKLCDRDYECNICPFDQAMRGETEGFKSETFPVFSIELTNFYHPSHVWIRIEGTDIVLLGIDSFLSSFIRYITSIVFPNVGERFSQNDCLCHVVEKRGIIPVSAPISGTVFSVNVILKKKPELLFQDPFGKGYLLKIKPDNLERDVKELLFGEEAMEWLKKEEARLFGLLSCLMQTKGLGQTMQDGGERAFTFLAELSEKEYVKLIGNFTKISRKQIPF